MRVRAVTIAVLVALSSAPAAHAYVIGGSRWPSHRITYFNADKAISIPVRLAVTAWNASGANVHFAPASRRAADVIIRKRRLPRAGKAVLQGLCEGYADIGHNKAPEHVDISPDCGGGIQIPAGVVAHELGHILGLDHATRGCATMTAGVWQFCKEPPHDWQYRCRLLQPDDVRGAIALYGGHVRRRAAFCDSFAPPAAPTDLAFDQSTHSISWRNPALPRPAIPGLDEPRLTAFVAFQRDTCPKPSDASNGFDSVVDAIPGAGQKLFVAPLQGFLPGTWCIAISIRDQYGRGSSSSTMIVVPPSTLSPSFAAQALPDLCVTFTDTSTDSDGHITGWLWDFGDGTMPEGTQTVTHCFGLSGLYVVTLTVLDDHNRSAAGSQQVVVTSPPLCTDACTASISRPLRGRAVPARSS